MRIEVVALHQTLNYGTNVFSTALMVLIDVPGTPEKFLLTECAMLGGNIETQAAGSTIVKLDEPKFHVWIIKARTTAEPGSEHERSYEAASLPC